MESDKTLARGTSDVNHLATTSSTAARHLCSACQKDWPESLMVRVRNGWECKLCNERQKPARTGNQKERPTVRRKVPWIVIAVAGAALTAIVSFGFARDKILALAGAESWAIKQPSEWPAIVSGNVADLPSQYIPANNAFTIELPDGSVVGGTTVILGEVSPKAEKKEAEQNLGFTFRQWTLLEGPSASPLVFNRIRPGAESAVQHGVIILSSSVPVKPDWITPLKLRRRASIFGSGLHIVAVRNTGGQNVYPVRKADAAAADSTQEIFELDRKVVLRELLGAPVVDASGRLVAIVSGSADTRHPEATTVRVTAFGSDALSSALGIKSNK